MQNNMTLPELMTEVIRQSKAKKDYVANTQDNVRLVMTDGGIVAELLKPNAEWLQRLTISENAHKQISDRLKVPWKYYDRLLGDHPDMIVDHVNKLFEREPKWRMLRTLDGEVRAFLSDQYNRLDNDQVLAHTLPAIKENINTTLLSTNVTPHYMNLKVLFTDDKFMHTITKAHGVERVIQPGFRLSNSETGKGQLKCEAFFFDNFCKNGCVFGKDDLVSFSRSHLGAKLKSNDTFEIESDETKKLSDQHIMSAIRDVIKALSSEEHVAKMAERLKVAANSETVKNPAKAVEMVTKDLTLSDTESFSVLETFLQDGDYSQFGLSAAVTNVANDPALATYERANKLENMGGHIIDLLPSQWRNYAEAR